MPVIIVCVILILLCALYLFMIAGKKPEERLAAPFRNLQCAHRGFYEKDQSVPENTPNFHQKARNFSQKALNFVENMNTL